MNRRDRLFMVGFALTAFVLLTWLCPWYPLLAAFGLSVVVGFIGVLVSAFWEV